MSGTELACVDGRFGPRERPWYRPPHADARQLASADLAHRNADREARRPHGKRSGAQNLHRAFARWHARNKALRGKCAAQLEQGQRKKSEQTQPRGNCAGGQRTRSANASRRARNSPPDPSFGDIQAAKLNRR
jgi:hypothetical protein